MKKRNFKIQRRIYRFVMWTSAIGAGWIIYREDLWWTLAVLVLYSWFRAGAQSVKGAYLNEIEQLRQIRFWCANEQEGGARCDGRCDNCVSKYRKPEDNEKAV